MNKRKIPTGKKLAEKMYEPSDYQSDDDLSRGLAATHEQLSDSYAQVVNETGLEKGQGKRSTEKSK